MSLAQLLVHYVAHLLHVVGFNSSFDSIVPYSFQQKDAT